MKVLVHHYKANTEAYRYNYQLSASGIIVESRHFPDRISCVENAYGVLKYLQRSPKPQDEVYLSKYKEHWVVNVADQYQLRLVHPANCTDSEEAGQIVERLLQTIHSDIELLDVSPEERQQYFSAAQSLLANPEEEEASEITEKEDIQLLEEAIPETGPTEGRSGFELYTETEEETPRYYFHFKDQTGTPLLRSEGYPSEEDRDSAVSEIYSTAVEQEHYEIHKEEAPYYFLLKNEAGTLLARSREFTDDKEMMRFIFWLRIHFKGKLPAKRGSRRGGLMINPASILNPKFSSGVMPKDGPCGKIFKPMEPLTAGDFSLFWGRDRELKDIYDLILGTDLLLLYGAARSGKSSLVRCGLPNYQQQAEWQGIVVERRGNIIKNFQHQLQRERKKLELGTNIDAQPTLDALRELQSHSEKPIFLVFDDLEELFTENPDPEEQQAFFALLHEVVQSDDHIKAILIIDESYLAHLTNYETVVPNLFEHRYRLEKMSRRGISSGLVDCFDMLNNINTVKVPDPKVTTEAIMAKMSNGKDQIEVACMQIYLNELQQEACRRKQNGEVLIDDKLVDSCDPPEQLIGAYLDKQRAEIRQQKTDNPEEAVAAQQKLQELEDVRNRCNCNPEPTPAAYPAWVSWAGWGLLLLLLLLFFWPRPGIPNAELNEQPTGCAQCSQYLESFGEEAPYAAFARQQLNSNSCQEWMDCQIAQEENSCETYIKYLEKYRNNGSCSEAFMNAIIRGCLLPANPEVVNNCKLLSEILPNSQLPPDMLCLIYEEYMAAFGADNSCSQVLADLRSGLPCEQPTEFSNTALSCTELRTKVNSGGQLSESERSALDQCACDEALAKADCNSYEVYLKKYGNDGRCSNDIRIALQELRQLDCPLPMGDICFLTATEQPVSWDNAHTQCPQGYRLICESQVRYLLEKFYKNDLRKSYSYMVGKIESSSLDFSAQGFWTATEFSDSEAYAIEKDVSKKSIKGPVGISKSETRPCLCIAPGPKFQESPISDLQCLSKSLSN